MTEDRGTAPGSGDDESGPQQASSSQLARGLSLGRYVVLERLGAGGMGVVYAAYDPELDRKVAIKLLGTGVPAARSGKLLEEAKQTASVSHRNVVTVHGVETFLGQVCIAMEFIGGGTLSSWLKTSPPWGEVVRCFLQAGEGLAAVHDRGLVHRDFKPDNVLLDADRQPRVTDFGLAQREEEARPPAASKTGRVAGTVGFLAPEQVRGKSVDARSDQFSFCLSLHLGLYGEPAFPRDADLQLPLPPVRPAPAGSAVPGWVRRVVLKGLSEDPAARFSSMRELLIALEADPARARRELLIRGGALALLFAVVALVVGFFQRESPEQRTTRECLRTVDAQLDSMWSAPRQDAIEKGFTGITPKEGAETWALVRDRLNPQLDAWTKTSRETCVQKGDPAVRARWAACLEERRKTLQSMSDLFARPDLEVLTHAVNTVLIEVAPAASCKSIEAASVVTVEGSAAADEGLRSRLARARVDRAAGNPLKAIGDARDVANEARRQKAVHVEAEAMLLIGEASSDKQRPDAEQNLRDAIIAAEKAGNDEVRARAWISLVYWYSVNGRLREARQADQQAKAIINRMGTPKLLHASQLNNAGILAAAADDPEAALRNYQQALEIRQALLEPGHPLLMKSLNNVGNSLPPSEGLPRLTEVLEKRILLFGATHPDTITASFNVGVAYLNLGLTWADPHQCETALQHLETARAQWLKDRRLRVVHSSIGLAFLCMGKLEDAESNHLKAVALLKEARPDEQLAELRQLLDVMVQLHRPAAAREPFEKQLERLNQ